MSELGHMASVGDYTMPVGCVMLQLPSKDQQGLGVCLFVGVWVVWFCWVLVLVVCLFLCFFFPRKWQKP